MRWSSFSCCFQKLRVYAQLPLHVCVLVSSCGDKAAKQTVSRTNTMAYNRRWLPFLLIDCELNSPIFQLRVGSRSCSGTWFEPSIAAKPDLQAHAKSAPDLVLMPTRMFQSPKQVTCPGPRQKKKCLLPWEAFQSHLTQE